MSSPASVINGQAARKSAMRWKTLCGGGPNVRSWAMASSPAAMPGAVFSSLQEWLHDIVVDALVLAVSQNALVVPLLPRDDRRLAVALVVRSGG